MLLRHFIDTEQAGDANGKVHGDDQGPKNLIATGKMEACGRISGHTTDRDRRRHRDSGDEQAIHKIILHLRIFAEDNAKVLHGPLSGEETVG